MKAPSIRKLAARASSSIQITANPSGSGIALPGSIANTNSGESARPTTVSSRCVPLMITGNESPGSIERARAKLSMRRISSERPGTGQRPLASTTPSRGGCAPSAGMLTIRPAAGSGSSGKGRLTSSLMRA